MKYKFLGILFLPLIIISCSNDNGININSNIHTLNNKLFHYGDSLNLIVDSQYQIDSITYQINNSNRKFIKKIIAQSDFDYGTNIIKQNIYFNKNNKKRKTSYTAELKILSNSKEKIIEYEITNRFKHNKSLFTQGFFITENGNIIESTGSKNRTSQLVEYQLGNEDFVKDIELSADYFGEGATKIDDEIYLLTWKSKKGFVYKENSFELISEFTYPTQIFEGWGLTSFENELILSDGTDKIYFIDSNNLSNYKRKISVVSFNKSYSNLNELEYINGFIYANVWQENIILKINPKNGIVEGKLDLTEICNKYNKNGVLNGIAYNRKNNTILLTGKFWPEIFEIALKE
jgi:glutamine cyclotransferase